MEVFLYACFLRALPTEAAQEFILKPARVYSHTWQEAARAGYSVRGGKLGAKAGRTVASLTSIHGYFT